MAVSFHDAYVERADIDLLNEGRYLNDSIIAYALEVLQYTPSMLEASVVLMPPSVV